MVRREGHTGGGVGAVDRAPNPRSRTTRADRGGPGGRRSSSRHRAARRAREDARRAGAGRARGERARRADEIARAARRDPRACSRRGGSAVKSRRTDVRERARMHRRPRHRRLRVVALRRATADGRGLRRHRDRAARVPSRASAAADRPVPRDRARRALRPRRASTRERIFRVVSVVRRARWRARRSRGGKRGRRRRSGAGRADRTPIRRTAQDFSRLWFSKNPELRFPKLSLY